MSNSALAKKTIVLTHTATPSGASTVEFTGLDAAYSMYEIIIANLSRSADGDLHLRTSTDGGSSYDSGVSDYSWVIGRISAGGGALTADAADAQIDIYTLGGGAGTDENTCGVLWLKQPSAAQYCHLTYHMHGETTTSDPRVNIGSGRRLSAANVDAIQIFPSSGTISGDIRIYGYKDA